MAKCRVIVHYYLKKGKEKEGKQFIEEKINTTGAKSGVQLIEVCQDEHNPSHIMTTGVWSTLEEAHQFEGKWEEFKHLAMEYCSKEPDREVYLMAA